MKKKFKLLSKILLAFIFVFIIFSAFNYNIYAEINDEYGDDPISIGIDADSVIKDSNILDMLGQFVYAIGNLIENATSGIVNLLTGESAFPWADRVIFNTMPLLDINFINPNERSIFSDTYGVGTVVRNIYFTGLSIALGFLAVIIAIMAIRLAISTIASEKAKYKEAIIKWLTAIILLFSMHFVLSFIFYLNEELVKVASQVLENTMEESGEDITLAIQNTLDSNMYAQVDNFIISADGSITYNEVRNWLNPIGLIVKAVDGVSDALGFGSEERTYPSKTDMLNTLRSEEYIDITYAYITNTVYRENLLNSFFDVTEGTGEIVWKSFWTGFGSFTNENICYEQLCVLYDYVMAVKHASEVDNEAYDAYTWVYDYINTEERYKQTIKNTDYAIANAKDDGERISAQVRKILFTYAYEYNVTDNLGAATTTQNLIGGLGNFFKETAWYSDVNHGGWSPNEVSVVSAILYTLFVIQSIMFFIAYFKRLFFVVILAIIAPFVVIYDFFTKSMSL